MLQLVEANDELLGSLASLLDHIRSLGAGDIDVVFRDASATGRQSMATRTSEPMDAGTIGGLTAEEVEQRIADAGTTKAELELIAAYRFGMPSGSLQRLSRAALSEKLKTSIRNERGHQSIRRLLKENDDSGDLGKR